MIGLFVTLFSTMIFACPDISGDYTCHELDTEWSMKWHFKVSEADGATVVRARVESDLTFILDGQEHKERDYVYVGSCSDDSIDIKFKEEGAIVGRVTIVNELGGLTVEESHYGEVRKAKCLSADAK